ncbi:hypothetical protein CI238_09490 [Colletotrichum incanum]|uniref:Uncharacterized protein n=1 Tax=Colletotrichum incanum TaxID=1573173 RepID=A0A167AZQ1_COLIC|nr:hypothetical protein CI238_09490 [Colletotrichum incanum]
MWVRQLRTFHCQLIHHVHRLARHSKQQTIKSSPANSDGNEHNPQRPTSLTAFGFVSAASTSHGRSACHNSVAHRVVWIVYTIWPGVVNLPHPCDDFTMIRFSIKPPPHFRNA